MMLAASGIVAWRLARRSRSEEFDDESVEVRRAGLAILVATLCLSNAARACLTSGQLGIAAAAAITGAIWARDRGRPILGALGFAVGSIKVGTVVPFALGLLRRGDLRLWLAAIGFSVLAVSFTEAPSEFASRARTWLETIGRLGAPGAVNDFARPGNDDMISLDRALFLAGLRDREQARFAQMLILGVIGATAAALVVRRRGELDARCWSLLAVFGSLFLYHRLTDMTILALPLATAMLESRRARGLRRGSMIILVILIITVLFMQRRLLVAVRAWADGRGDFRARLAEAVVLPHATWSLLLVFFLLALDLAFVGPSKTPATDHPPR
jgi:preprotein translocase subunit SecG